MANHPSAEKAHRQTIKRTERNRATRSALRTAIKKLRAAIAEKKADQVEKLLPATIARIDRTAKKKIIHPNAADRYKARLSAQARSVVKTAR